MPSKAEIASHFTAIARRYDLANTLLSFGIERSWRRRMVQAAALQPGLRVLDVCTGTAIIISDLRRAGTDCSFVGVDLTPGMLRRGATRLSAASADADVLLVNGDACRLPVPDGSFDRVTAGFGLRNLPDPSQGIGEMARVLKKGGKLVIMEFAPHQPGLLGSLYGLYRRIFIPLIGGAVTGAPAAYRHLSTSIRDFLTPENVISLFERHGMKNTAAIPLTANIAFIYVGEKA